MTNTTEIQAQAATILQRAVCLTLRCSWFYNLRPVNTEDIDIVKRDDDGDTEVFIADDDGVARTQRRGRSLRRKKQVSLKKHLVDPRWLRPANRVMNQAKNYLASKAIPTPHVFGERSYLIPTALLREAWDRLHQFQADLELGVDNVIACWPNAIAEQQLELGPLFNRADYPTEDDVRRAWAIDFYVTEFAAPELLRTVDDALFAEASDRSERMWADARDEARLVLRETLRDITRTIAGKLAPGDDLRPRTFRSSTVLSDLVEFLSTFNFRDLTDDVQLASEVARLRALAGGIDPRSLLEDTGLRAEVHGEMAEATARLDDLVVTAGRAISFGGFSA